MSKESIGAPDIQAAFSAALRLHAAGRLAEAEDGYRRVLAAAPEHPDALHMLGVIAYQEKRMDSAVDLIEKALALKPDYPEALYNLGNALRESGRAEEAVARYLKAVALKPDYADAHNNLGISLRAVGRVEEAIASFRAAIAGAPQLMEAHLNLGEALLELNRFDEAMECFETVLAAWPGNVKALFDLGKCLDGVARTKEAIACFERALAIAPSDADGLCALGSILLRLKRNEEALGIYGRAVAAAPDSALARNGMACALKEVGRQDEALAAFETASALDPDNATIHCNMGIVYRDMHREEEALAAYKKALSIDPEYLEARTLLISATNYVADFSKDELFEISCRYGDSVARLAKPFKDHKNDKSPDRRLRAGFVSGDLCSHPVGFFLEGALAELNAETVELFAYSTTAKDDSVTQKLKTLMSVWRDVRLVSDARLADMIVGDGIDILIDLAGHTAGNRLPVFAWKPAPIQVAWIGYVATTGVREIDYILCDRWVMPPEEERYFVEKPFRLPNNYLCFSMPAFDIDVGPLPADRNGYITFGSFNNLTKINEPLIACWAKTLLAVPDSRLYLKTLLLGKDGVRGKICKSFANHGISPDRLILEGASPRRDLLESYNAVDIALDTFPYTGGVTSIEAMWMGAPVLTLSGNSYSSRIGESVVSNAGLPDWVAHSPDDYVAAALRHASDTDGLRALRASLRGKLLASSLGDSALFARGLEGAFREMWRAWCAGGQT